MDCRRYNLISEANFILEDVEASPDRDPEPCDSHFYRFSSSSQDVIAVRMFVQSTDNHRNGHDEEMGNPASTSITNMSESDYCPRSVPHSAQQEGVCRAILLVWQYSMEFLVLISYH